MMNKLEALRYFCSAAETLNFRETAQRLAVSPQVVTRMIADLETLLGEACLNVTRETSNSPNLASNFYRSHAILGGRGTTFRCKQSK